MRTRKIVFDKQTFVLSVFVLTRFDCILYTELYPHAGDGASVLGVIISLLLVSRVNYFRILWCPVHSSFKSSCPHN